MDGTPGLNYLDALQGMDEPIHDSSLLYPHFASLTAMGPSTSALDPSSSALHPNHFLFSSQSPSILFSPYREMEWLDRPLRDVAGSGADEDGMGVPMGAMMDNGGQGGSSRKRTWSDRVSAESRDKKYQRMERNRIRMAEKRARETDEERRARLDNAKDYMKRKQEQETQEESLRRKEINRVRTRIRRGKMAEERSLEDQLQSMLKEGSREETKEENEGERSKRRELARLYASSKRRRETPEQRNARLSKNRDRMRNLRACKKEEWRAFLEQREIIEDRLHLMRMQLGEKSPLLESDSILASRLAELLRVLANSSRRKRGGKNDVTVRDWDVFLLSRLPPILSALENLLSTGDKSTEGDETFVFGAEASYLDYVLFEELDALVGLCYSVLDPYPTLRGYRERFQQGIHLTTYALMQAGSTLNLTCDSMDSTAVSDEPIETHHLMLSEPFDEVLSV